MANVSELREAHAIMEQKYNAVVADYETAKRAVGLANAVMTPAWSSTYINSTVNAAQELEMTQFYIKNLRDTLVQLYQQILGAESAM